MSLLFELRRRLRSAVVPALCAGLVAYFTIHAVQGQHGLLAWVQVAQQIERVRTDLAVAQAARAALEQKVALLRPDTLDRDMLDEQVRRVLGYVRPDEFVIFPEG